MKNTEIHKSLITKNLSIGYKNKKSINIVAKNINLELKENKLVAILGKNGIGKSTFLRTISKVQPTLEGEIFIQNKKVKEYTNKELATKLSLVLTERLPESQLTVIELIALGRQPYTNWIDSLSKKDKEKINWAIELTETEHLKNKKVHELSDGQLQSVLIARALAQDTEIIILDEPTAHLDIHHTYKIFSLLKKLVTDTNKTIIISTHQVNLAIQIADDFILFSEEKIAMGNLEELLKTNAFNKLFPEELIEFNATLKQFNIKKN